MIEVFIYDGKTTIFCVRFNTPHPALNFDGKSCNVNNAATAQRQHCSAVCKLCPLKLGRYGVGAVTHHADIKELEATETNSASSHVAFV